MSECNQTAGVVTAISAVIVLFVSELLPFLPIPSNGIVHSLVTALRKQLPVNQQP